MQTIENKQFKAQIDERGAQLIHLFNNEGNFDYIWNNDLWPKHAPVLFPAIGRSEADAYQFNGQTYEMPQHGFVSEETFTVEENDGAKLILALTDNSTTQRYYPFHFKLTITFTLSDEGLNFNFKVDNLDNQTFSFSLGSHPAFNVPIDGEGEFSDYELTFSPNDLDLQQFEIVKTPAPFRDGKIIPLVAADKSNIKLNYDMFADGLVIVENNGISGVKLSSAKSSHNIELSLTDFRYVCLWTKEGANAPFLCIEPFQGLPDISGQQSELLTKEANVVLDSGKAKTFEYQITLK